MKYDVFISYSRKNKEIVNRFANELKSHGYNIWMDVDGIESGDAFKVKIVNAIRDSSLFLFFSSNASNESEWTVKEVNVAVLMHKPIIPIKLDNCIYNDSILFDLSGMDYIESMDKETFDSSVKRLLRSLQNKKPKKDDFSQNENAPNFAEFILFATNMAMSFGAASIKDDFKYTNALDMYIDYMKRKKQENKSKFSSYLF